MSAPLGSAPNTTNNRMELTAAIEARDVVAMVGLLYADEFRALAERLPTDDPALSRLLLLVYSADRVAEAEQAWTATKVVAEAEAERSAEWPSAGLVTR